MISFKQQYSSDGLEYLISFNELDFLGCKYEILVTNKDLVIKSNGWYNTVDRYRFDVKTGVYPHEIKHMKIFSKNYPEVASILKIKGIL